MDHELIEKQFYESYWKKVNRNFSKDENHYTSNKPLKSVSKFSRNKGLALDIGCGNGRHTKLFRKCIAIDISESSVLFAKQNSKKPIVKASILHVPFKENTFYSVLDSGCLHHLRKSQFKSYRKNILEIMKKGGYYCLYCFSKKSGHVKKFTPSTKNRNFTLRNGHYNHFFTKKEITDLFRKDFEIKIKEVKNKNSEIRFYIVFAKKL